MQRTLLICESTLQKQKMLGAPCLLLLRWNNQINSCNGPLNSKHQFKQTVNFISSSTLAAFPQILGQADAVRFCVVCDGISLRAARMNNNRGSYIWLMSWGEISPQFLLHMSTISWASTNETLIPWEQHHWKKRITRLTRNNDVGIFFINIGFY